MDKHIPCPTPHGHRSFPLPLPLPRRLTVRARVLSLSERTDTFVRPTLLRVPVLFDETCEARRHTGRLEGQVRDGEVCEHGAAAGRGLQALAPLV